MKYLNSTLVFCAVIFTLSFPLAAETEKNIPPHLTVCVNADNPPFSQQTSGGADVDIARALGENMHREVGLFWVQIPGRGGLGKALKQSIQAGRCDLYMGLPDAEEMTRDLAEHHLKKSNPYTSVGYVFVTARSPAAVPTTRVGVVTATPADLYLHVNKFNRIPYANNNDLIEAVVNGDVAKALIWSPALARYRLQFKDAPLKIEAIQPKDENLRNRLVMAACSNSGSLIEDVNRALVELEKSGTLAKINENNALITLPPI